MKATSKLFFKQLPRNSIGMHYVAQKQVMKGYLEAIYNISLIISMISNHDFCNIRNKQRVWKTFETSNNYAKFLEKNKQQLQRFQNCRLSEFLLCCL